MLGIVEKDVDKAVESVQEYYNNIDSNIDNVIEQIEMMISNSTDDQIMKANIRDTIKPFAKQYSDKHKDLHGSISKIGKTIDKCFHADFGNVPIFELFDKPEKLKLIYMIICEDLYRQGRMSIAQQLIEETNLKDNELFNVEKKFLEEINMILENLREKNLVPALEWCQKKRNELDKAGSLLEFHLHKMRFVQLLQMGNFDEAKGFQSNDTKKNLGDGQISTNQSALTPETKTSPVIGIGLDSCVLPLRHGGLVLVQSTDFFYPLIDDPYVMGKIACANVLSDIYAMGAIEIDNMLMLLSTSNKMSEKERDTIMPLILEGFKDCAEEAGTSVQGGQTVINPWLIVGGVATSICIPSEIIIPEHAVVGDVLVLTKPLGTQVAVNAHQWIENPDRWNRIKSVVTEDEVRKGYKRAMSSMARLNKTGGKLMHKYNAHACTDVTGFGLLGHAENLVKYQKNEVSFVIHNLPIIAKMATITKACNDMFSLLQGKSAETSGGLLVVLPHEQAAAFCKDIEAQEGYRAWIIGVVEKGDRTAKIVDKPRIIEVPEKDTEDTMAVNKESIEKKLRDELEPTYLAVEDFSSGCGLKFDAVIVSKKFD
ncbi:unnamed protein product, partial [Rotaria magnacalcarata]